MARPAKYTWDYKFEYHPVTPARLDDLKRFSRKYGKFGYCACMRWRLRSADFQRSTKEERIARLEHLVRENVPVGILGYDGHEPIGWCSVAPRDTYHALQSSRVLPALDTVSVWSVVCFYVDPQYRGQQLSVGLLKAAVQYALSEGAEAVEAYPVPPASTSYRFMGVPKLFMEVGFVDVTPRGQKRMVVRYVPS